MPNKKQDLSKQYNEFSNLFSEVISSDNNISRKTFYKSLNFNFKSKELLDLACGDGQDIKEYESRGANCYGLDASEELIKLATSNNIKSRLVVGDMKKLPYKSGSFDIVLSKYAIGTVKNIDLVFKEVSRVLKKGGVFAYLNTHPMRLFLESNKLNKNYFNQINVKLSVFNGKFTIVEPSHTFNEIFSKTYLDNFELKSFSEHYDPQSADFPNRDVYPDFYIATAIKK